MRCPRLNLESEIGGPQWRCLYDRDLVFAYAFDEAPLRAGKAELKQSISLRA